MDPDLLKEMYHWIPTPLLAIGFYILLRRAFNDFEGQLATVVADLKSFLKEFNTHERRVDRIEERTDELWKIRHRPDQQQIEIERLKSYIWGSGPKKNPLLRSPEGDE